MSRYSRRSDPALRPKQRVELTTGKIALRLMVVGIAILVASLAFGAVVNNLVSTQTGWQQVEAANPETGIAQDFILCYNIGQTEAAAGTELKALSSHYGQLLDNAYRVLSNVPMENVVNLHTLNSRPNTAVAVDPLLYAAFQTLEESGSRLVYFAPMLEQYRSLYACEYDQEAEKFDPERSEELARFAGEIARFARDPEAVQVKLLPENTLRLEVSPEYLDFAGENELESFVDLGLLLNAFLCDAVAEGLTELGYVNGYVTSFDGFTRTMCPEEFGLSVYDLKEGEAQLLDTALYDGPCTLVSCRSFPVLDMDAVNYYRYADGTLRGPYLNEQGLLHAACASLYTLSRELTTAQLAIRTLEAYAQEDASFPSLEEISWVSGENGQAAYHGTDFRPAE